MAKRAILLLQKLVNWPVGARLAGTVCADPGTRHQAREALKRVAAGETLREIALSYNVDHSTISRLKARYAAEV
jgi:hypothetical protein